MKRGGFVFIFFEKGLVDYEYMLSLQSVCK